MTGSRGRRRGIDRVTTSACFESSTQLSGGDGGWGFAMAQLALIRMTWRRTPGLPFGNHLDKGKFTYYLLPGTCADDAPDEELSYWLRRNAPRSSAATRKA
jgi:hypothetical protein